MPPRLVVTMLVPGAARSTKLPNVEKLARWSVSLVAATTSMTPLGAVELDAPVFPAQTTTTPPFDRKYAAAVCTVLLADTPTKLMFATRAPRSAAQYRPCATALQYPRPLASEMRIGMMRALPATEAMPTALFDRAAA